MPTYSRKQRRAKERAQAEAVKGAPTSVTLDIETYHKSAHRDDFLDAVRYGFTQVGQRHVGKHKALAAAYGMNKSRIIGDEFHTQAAMWPTKRELQVPYPISQLNPVEQRWARAFFEVMGAGEHFYAEANAQRRRYLEQHYMEMATHDTRRGRKAAKVVTHFVASGLDDPAPMFESKGLQTGRTMGGKTMVQMNRMMNQQMQAYATVFGPFVKEKPDGSV